jgi:hypothetical protein
LNVSKRTVEYRMQEYGLSVGSQYSDMADDALDAEVFSILQAFPNAGKPTSFFNLRGA